MNPSLAIKYEMLEEYKRKIEKKKSEEKEEKLWFDK